MPDGTRVVIKRTKREKQMIEREEEVPLMRKV